MGYRESLEILPWQVGSHVSWQRRWSLSWRPRALASMDPAYTELVVERAGAPWKNQGRRLVARKGRSKSTPLGGCFQLRNFGLDDSVAAGEPPRQVKWMIEDYLPLHAIWLRDAPTAEGTWKCPSSSTASPQRWSTPTMSLENDTWSAEVLKRKDDGGVEFPVPENGAASGTTSSIWNKREWSAQRTPEFTQPQRQLQHCEERRTISRHIWGNTSTPIPRKPKVEFEIWSLVFLLGKYIHY